MLKKFYRKLKSLSLKSFIRLKLISFASDVGILTSLFYYFHWRTCQIKGRKHIYFQNFRRDGFFAIPQLNKKTNELDADRYTEINSHLSEIFTEETEFFHNLHPQSNSDALYKFIADYIETHKETIKLALGSHFQIHRIVAYRTFSGNNTEDKESSFAWHYDSAPFSMSKLFIYLDDTKAENGAFSYIDLNSSKKLFRDGFISSNGFRTISQKLIDTKVEKHFFEGKVGDSFIFNPNIIHRATYPEIGRRTIICLEIYPSSTPISRENIINSLAIDIDKDYPAYPKYPWANRYTKLNA
jgi:hypothetical protein